MIQTSAALLPSTARRALAFAAMPLGLALFAACADTPLSLAPDDVPEQLIEWDIHVSPKAIEPGDSVGIRVALRNVSGVPLELTFSSGCQVVHGIRGPSGDIVVPHGGGWFCGGVLTELMLEPGAEHVVTTGWDGTVYDAESESRVAAPPGTYGVFGALGGAMDRKSEPVPLTRLPD